MACSRCSRLAFWLLETRARAKQALISSCRTVSMLSSLTGLLQMRFDALIDAFLEHFLFGPWPGLEYPELPVISEGPPPAQGFIVLAHQPGRFLPGDEFHRCVHCPIPPKPVPRAGFRKASRRPPAEPFNIK